MRMPTFVRAIEKDLILGHELDPVPNRIGRWFVIAPTGTRLTNPDGTPIVVGKAETPKSEARLRAQLEVAGAIERQRRREAHERHAPHRVPSEAGQNPIVMARLILGDPKATPREKKMAHAYLELLEKHATVRALAQNLGHQLKERAAQEPRRVYI